VGKNIFVFSGLGADEKAFQRIDFSGHDVTHIKWLAPGVHEDIESYAMRLLPQINSRNPILLGLSFGGLLAVEAGKHISTERIILLSSAKNKNEIPSYYKTAHWLGLQKLIPYKSFKKPNFITNFLFGAKTEEEKKLLKQMLANTDLAFMKWAMQKIPTWKNEYVHEHLIHIHGTSDKILPYRFVDCNYPIKSGEHFMVVNRSDELNELLKNLFCDEPALN
jgi:esterase/lipase